MRIYIYIAQCLPHDQMAACNSMHAADMHPVYTVCTCGTDVVQAVPITTGGASVGALIRIEH